MTLHKLLALIAFICMVLAVFLDVTANSLLLSPLGWVAAGLAVWQLHHLLRDRQL